jgi:hypothetical protein
MLVSEMLSEMRDHGFDDLTDTRLLSFINDTYYDVATREPWPFLEVQATPTVNASTGQVTSPTDIKQVLKLVDTVHGTRLEPIRGDDFIQINADRLTTTGQPLGYYFVGSALYLYPIPTSGTFKLLYLKAPAALTVSPDSSPILPTVHHRLIVLGALVKCYMLEDDAENAAVFTNMFEQRLQQMRNDLWMHQYDRPDTIFDVDEYDWVDWLADWTT